MKTLLYARHSEKEGKIIGKEGLERAQKEAPNGNFTDVFHGIVLRTAQTLLAVVASLGCKVRVHLPIDEIGSDDLFAEMVTPEFKEAVGEGKTNIEALYKAHSKEKTDAWAANALEGVKKMFDAMEDNGFGLAYGHDPVIPLAAVALGYEAPSLKPLEGIGFIQTDDGNIAMIK